MKYVYLKIDLNLYALYSFQRVFSKSAIWRGVVTEVRYSYGFTFVGVKSHLPGRSPATERIKVWLQNDCVSYRVCYLSVNFCVVRECFNFRFDTTRDIVNVSQKKYTSKNRSLRRTWYYWRPFGTCSSYNNMSTHQRLIMWFLHFYTLVLLELNGNNKWYSILQGIQTPSRLASGLWCSGEFIESEIVCKIFRFQFSWQI